MDLITHLALGACTGELLLSKKIGKKALLWGALSQALPDIDTAGVFFYPADKALLIHRGITHSFFFAIVTGLVLAFIFKRIHNRSAIAFGTLCLFFCFELALHDLLDVCNAYGTGLLEPFSHQRFSINLLYVADPFFTISLLVASIVLIFTGIERPGRINQALGAVFISIAYLAFAAFNKQYIDKRAQLAFINKDVPAGTYVTTPAPFNCMLWYLVVKSDTGFYTGYSSIWDDPKLPVNFERQSQNKQLFNQPDNDTSIKLNLLKFAGDSYTLSLSGNTVNINIPRFGQVQGWENGKAPFAFSYPLVKSTGEYLILQRGRLAGWDKNSIKQYLKRIAGNRH